MARPDRATTNLFCGHITWLTDQGITDGYPDGTYRPTNPVDRQAMAAFLHRAQSGALSSEG